jgi:hypothetical protein
MRLDNTNDPIQKHFSELIPRFRNGDATIEDYKLLTSRVPTPLNELLFQNAIRILPENLPCNKYNIQKVSEINNPITAFYARNIPNSARELDEDQVNGKNKFKYFSQIIF